MFKAIPSFATALTIEDKPCYCAWVKRSESLFTVSSGKLCA